jgi:hypothetical protein
MSMYDTFDKKIREAIKANGQRKLHVIYSAYKSDADDEAIDNLHKIAVRGSCILVAGRDEFFGGRGSKDYRSPVLDRPTWLTVAVHANNMITTVRDGHHVFLEGLRRLPRKMWQSEVPEYEFVMGS